MSELKTEIEEVTEQREVRDAYGFAFALVLISTLGLIAADAELASWITVGASTLQVAALIATLRVSGFGRKRTAAASATMFVLFIVAIVGAATVSNPGRVLGVVIWFLLVATAIVAVGKRLATYRRVNVQMVAGLTVIYLLLGVGFALLYVLFETLGIQSFAQGPQNVSSALYYSFITMATVGYGDITPIAGVARAVAVSEAIIGQLYLVAVVGLAVGRLGTSRSHAAHPEAAKDEHAADSKSEAR